MVGLLFWTEPKPAECGRERRAEIAERLDGTGDFSNRAENACRLHSNQREKGKREKGGKGTERLSFDQVKDRSMKTRSKIEAGSKGRTGKQSHEI
jgi:hypothetical protein